MRERWNCYVFNARRHGSRSKVRAQVSDLAQCVFSALLLGKS